MSTAVALGVGVFAGGSLAFLSGWGLRDLTRRQERRNLASALIGEIVAVLRGIEVHDVVAKVARAADPAGDARLEPAGFELPPFTIYQANAGKFTLLPAPLPRQIAFLYTRLTTIATELAALAEPSGARRAAYAGRSLAELRQALDLADDILRSLRGFVSARRPRSISRA